MVIQLDEIRFAPIVGVTFQATLSDYYNPYYRSVSIIPDMLEYEPLKELRKLLHIIAYGRVKQYENNHTNDIIEDIKQLAIRVVAEDKMDMKIKVCRIRGNFEQLTNFTVCLE